MKFVVLCSGKQKPRALRELTDDYLKRIGRMARIDEREVADDKALIKSIPEGAHLVALEVHGRQLTSEALARQVDGEQRDAVAVDPDRTDVRHARPPGGRTHVQLGRLRRGRTSGHPTGDRQGQTSPLERGARLDIFAAAMLGMLDVVKTALTACPDARKSLGAHGIPLIVHAKMGGEPAREVYEFLESLA